MRYCRDMKREAKIEFRVSAEEKARIEGDAEQVGVTVSEWVRARALATAPFKGSPPGLAFPVGLPDGGWLEAPGKAETREQYVERRTQILYDEGHTTRRAKAQAEWEWHEAHPDN